MNRNLIAIALGVVLVAVYVFAISPLSERRIIVQEQMRADYATLIKYRKFISGSEDAGPRLDAARSGVAALERHVLPNDDLSVVFAQLQINVQTLAERAGLKIRSVKPLPTEKLGQYTGLPLFIDCTGGIDALSGFLRSLDSEDVFISIDRLNIISTRQPSGLRIKMQLRGLMAP